MARSDRELDLFQYLVVVWFGPASVQRAVADVLVADTRSTPIAGTTVSRLRNQLHLKAAQIVDALRELIDLQWVRKLPPKSGKTTETDACLLVVDDWLYQRVRISIRQHNLTMRVSDPVLRCTSAGCTSPALSIEDGWNAMKTQKCSVCGKESMRMQYAVPIERLREWDAYYTELGRRVAAIDEEVAAREAPKEEEKKKDEPVKRIQERQGGDTPWEISKEEVVPMSVSPVATSFAEQLEYLRLTSSEPEPAPSAVMMTVGGREVSLSDVTQDVLERMTEEELGVYERLSGNGDG